MENDRLIRNQKKRKLAAQSCNFVMLMGCQQAGLPAPSSQVVLYRGLDEVVTETKLLIPSFFVIPTLIKGTAIGMKVNGSCRHEKMKVLTFSLGETADLKIFH